MKKKQKELLMTTGYNREEEYFKKKDQELIDAMIHQTVWIIAWDTESGDSGFEGVWYHKPSEEEQVAYLKKKFPGEFDAIEDGEDPYIYWNVVEFTIKERIGD